MTRLMLFSRGPLLAVDCDADLGPASSWSATAGGVEGSTAAATCGMLFPKRGPSER